MVEIIVGRAGSGKTFHCLQQAKKILETRPLKTEIVFLLPAYQTYRAELELANLTGGAVNTRMNSFNRFARQILDETDGALVPRISEIGRRLLLRKILLQRDKAGDLKFFVRAAKQRGFTEFLSDELKELKNYSIDGEKLTQVADSVDDAELKDKISDLALLSEDFQAILSDKLTDDENLLARATEMLPNFPTIALAEVFVDGFIFFDPQQRNFLRQLFKCAANVHVTLPMDANFNSRENISELGTFNRSFETFKTLKTLAAEAKTDFQVTKLTSTRRFHAETLEILEKRLFNYAPKSFDGSNGLKFVEAVNKRAEIEATAREILKIVKQGYRLREIGVLVRDESYFDLIKPIFELHSLPFFADRKRAAAHHPLAELIRSALEVLQRNWRRESVFRCVRTGFFDISAADVDLIENYVVEFGIKGVNSWQKPWNLFREKNLDKPTLPDEKINALLANINVVRKKIAAPLLKFAERVKNANREVIELTTALFQLLEDLHVHEKLDEWSHAEEIRGNLALSRENLKIWDDVVDLLEQIVDSLGADTISQKDFESIVVEGLDALEMSLIPPGLDEITVAQFDQNSLQNSRAIFLLGFTENDFPRRLSEKNLLTDADRLKIHDAQVEISLGGREKALAEKFLIYRGLTEARDFMQISWPAADGEGKKVSPSILLAKMQKIFPKIPTEKVSLDVLNNLGSEIDFVAPEKTLSKEIARKLYAPERKIRSSVSKIESFNKCPFKFFAEHGLKLQERVEYKVQTPDIGNILHAVMNNFGRELKNENRTWSSVEKNELVSRVDRILDEITPGLHNKILSSTKTLEHRRERIKNVAVESLERLIELDKVSFFQPKVFEAGFGDVEAKKIADDVELNLSGRIDRVDLSDDGKYFLIVDYKTGKTTLKLEKIYYGLQLQLAIYLGAAKNLPEVENREGIAMLYCLLRIPNSRGDTDEAAHAEARKEIKMPGLIRVDESIKNAVDSTGNFVYFDEKRKSNLMSSDELKIIVDYAEKLLQTTAERILSGCIDVEPVKSSSDDACKNCLFSALCNFDRGINETKKIGGLNRENILERMKNELA